MIKPVTTKQTNKYLDHYGKYVSKLFNLVGVGDTKQDAEQNLLNLIEWSSNMFYKIFQHNNIIFILNRSSHINEYQYFRIEKGMAQGMSIFSAESDNDAIEKASEWFKQYIA